MSNRPSGRKPALATRKIPRQQRSRQMVASILEAAARILEARTVPFTTNHIAEKAGVSIGSLYQYFPNADAIMAALIQQHVAEERAAAGAVLASAREPGPEVLRGLLAAFVEAHTVAPRLTARLHQVAPMFGLQDHLAAARDEQAAVIARALDLPVEDVQLAVMAVEGVVLATLARDPGRLTSAGFMDKLYAIAAAPLPRQPGPA